MSHMHMHGTGAEPSSRSPMSRGAVWILYRYDRRASHRLLVLRGRQESA